MEQMTPEEKRLLAYGFQHFLDYLQSIGIVLAQEGDWNEQDGLYELTTVETPVSDLIEQYIQSTRV